MTALGRFCEGLAGCAEREAFVFRSKIVSYGQFSADIEGRLGLLKQRAVAAGDVVALPGDYSPAACAVFLALLRVGAIVVPVAPMARTEVESRLRISRANKVVRWTASGWSVSQVDSRRPEHRLYEELRAEGHPGIVLFSSGSTGEPKGIVHDVERLLTKFTGSAKSLRTLSFLMFDHIGGLNTMFYALDAGGTLIICHERTPSAICEIIQEHRVELLPTSPTFLNLLLLSEAYKGKDLTSLKIISYGTEPMPESTLRRLHEAIPGVRLLQTYGLSEVGILGTRSESSESLWMKIGGRGFETRVVDGRLWIRGSSNMLGYLNAPSPFSEDGWFDTGDLVEQQGEYFRILGRESDMINVGGQKVHPSEVESVLLQMPEIHDVAVHGEANSILGEIVVAVVQLREPLPLSELLVRIRGFCKGKLQAFKIPMRLTLADTAIRTDRFKKTRRKSRGRI